MDLRVGALPTATELAQIGRLLGMLGGGDWRWTIAANPDPAWLLVDCEAIVAIDCPDPTPKFALWRETGHVYRVGPDGAVEDDPFLEAKPQHPATARVRELADDLDRYRGYPADHSDMERAVGVELRHVGEQIVTPLSVWDGPRFKCDSCERVTVSGLCGCQNPQPRPTTELPAPTTVRPLAEKKGWRRLLRWSA